LKLRAADAPARIEAVRGYGFRIEVAEAAEGPTGLPGRRSVNAEARFAPIVPP
jgi:hypothetical protein